MFSFVYFSCCSYMLGWFLYFTIHLLIKFVKVSDWITVILLMLRLLTIVRLWYSWQRDTVISLLSIFFLFSSVFYFRNLLWNLAFVIISFERYFFIKGIWLPQKNFCLSRGVCPNEKVWKPNQGSGKHKGGSRNFVKKNTYQSVRKSDRANRSSEGIYFMSSETHEFN